MKRRPKAQWTEVLKEGKGELTTESDIFYDMKLLLPMRVINLRMERYQEHNISITGEIV